MFPVAVNKKAEMRRTKANNADQLAGDKAEAILAGAMQEFLAQGYAATSMDQIAIAAGVSKATVYKHFQDKEGLFNALVQYMARRKAVFDLQTLQTLQGEPPVVLRHIAEGMLNNIMLDPQILAFIRLIIGESGRFPELARAFVQNIEKPTIDFLSQYLTAHPELQLSDPEVAARAFIGTLVHHIILQEMLHSADILPMKKERLIEHLTTLVVGDRTSTNR
jgi:TetR/AcrR family transcriptional regulator, regulator of autoinduction and epiphytic fitness